LTEEDYTPANREFIVAATMNYNDRAAAAAAAAGTKIHPTASYHDV